MIAWDWRKSWNQKEQLGVKIKIVDHFDIPIWITLSKEYDKYVQEIVSDITEWYDGNETSLSFYDYMNSKINKKEAFMAVDENSNCCGIVSVSKTNNRITFFAVSHKCDFEKTGKFLLVHALSMLDKGERITANVIKSNAEQIRREYTLLLQHGFDYVFDGFENGVPVNCMETKPILAE